ncbi:MAG: hypothetical protein NUV32_05795 [Exilispira sp.]|jgi:hypothetical protein|nr:hypothetical protein [Exilispira sp.]
MISYYDQDICISEIICFEGKLAFVSEKSCFDFSTSTQVSDLGMIDQFYIIDVKKSYSSFIHVTSLDYNEFKKKFEIEKIKILLNSTIKPAILSITKESKFKKVNLIKIIEEKMPCDLISHYISRFGLLLVFSKFDFENDLFQKKLIERCRKNQMERILPFSIKTKYEILGKTFIWLYFPEDLFLIQNKNLFINFLTFYDISTLFKPIFDFRFKISTLSFEIFEKLKPSILPSIYFIMNQKDFAINYFNEKRVEIIESTNFDKIYKEYIKMVSQI